MQELNDRRSLQRSLKRGSVFTSDAAEAVNERTRLISTREYGVPLFQIDEVVTIVKDTTPGVSTSCASFLFLRFTKIPTDFCLKFV